MPELPEVETARRLVDRAARGRRIETVTCAADPLVFERVAPRRIRAALEGARVTGSGRRGKHFWLELDRRPWPCFHLGMTGDITVYRERGLRPRFLKLELELDGGRRVALSDPRRLGRVRLRDDPRTEPPVSRLGFDPLLDLPSPRHFAAALRGHRRALKALLLDQGFSAGVGNWIADEVLFQARLDPRRPASTVDDSGARRLHAALRRVIGHAVAVGSDDARFPRHWLFHVRWGRRQDAVTAAGDPVRFLTIAGRTTAWVPAVQR